MHLIQLTFSEQETVDYWKKALSLTVEKEHTGNHPVYALYKDGECIDEVPVDCRVYKDHEDNIYYLHPKYAFPLVRKDGL